MTFRIASAMVSPGGATGPIVMPAGTVATDHVLIAYGTSGAVLPITVALPAGASAVAVVPVRTDNNIGWALYEVTGVVAGDTVSLNTATPLAKTLQAFVFTEDIGVQGGLGTRAGVSQAFTTIPGRAILPGAKMLIFAAERTLSAGTAISSVSVSTGEPVTQLSYSEETTVSDSFYLGEFTAGQNPTGSATVTYSGGSGNGVGIQIVEVAGNEAIPQIAPVFGQAAQFTTGISIPGLPGQFKAASPIASGPDVVSVAVPSGTTPSDWVYIVTTWGNGSVRTVTITEPAAKLPASIVIPSRHDANIGWAIHAMTGLVTGDVVKVVLADGTASNAAVKLFVFDSKLSQPGLIGSRAGAVATTVVPGVAVVPNNPVYIFAVERTTTDGTLVTNAVNANGSTVAQAAGDEIGGDPDTSFYLGQLTPTTANSGSTTLTYNMAAGSGNGAGVSIPAVAAPANAQPTFGNQKLYFTATIAPPDGLVRVNLGRPTESTIRVKTFTRNVSSVRMAASFSLNMANPIWSSTVTPDADGYAYMEVVALQADTVFYWQIEVDGVLTGTINTCQTWPAPGTIVPVVAIEVGSCQKAFGSMNGPTNPQTFQHMVARIDAAGNRARVWIDLGDDFYPHSGTSPLGTVFPPSAMAMRNYWEAQHGQSQRTAFHKQIPTAHTYSDNDFIGSNSDSTEAPDVSTIANKVRRQVLCDGPFGSTDNVGLYWSYMLGRTLIIHTDSRSYSSNVLLPNSTVGKSMLGTAQKAWLKEQFTRIDAKAIVWCHDNQWVGNPGVSSARPGLDNWQAFATERQELADFIVANQVPILLYLHGDNHGLMFDDGTNNPYGGFAYAMTAPIYQDSGAWAGTTTGGVYGAGANSQLFTWVEITDDGTHITARVDGIDTATGVVVVKLSNATSVKALRPVDWLMHEYYRNIEAADVVGVSTGGGAGEAGVEGPVGPPGPAGAAGPGVVAGGVTGQVLGKRSAIDYDTVWVEQTGGTGGGVDEVYVGIGAPTGEEEIWYDSDAPTLRVKVDGNWVDVVTGPPGPEGPPGDSTSIFEYTFDASTVPTKTDGRVWLNNVDQTVATTMWVAYTSAIGRDLNFALGNIRPGTDIMLQEKDSSAAHQKYECSDMPIDYPAQTYWEIPVRWVEGGSPVVGSQRVLLAVANQGLPGQSLNRLDGLLFSSSTNINTIVPAGVWLNQATQSAAQVVCIAHTDVYGRDMQTAIASIQVGTRIVLQDPADAQKIQEFVAEDLPYPDDIGPGSFSRVNVRWSAGENSLTSGPVVVGLSGDPGPEGWGGLPGNPVLWGRWQVGPVGGACQQYAICFAANGLSALIGSFDGAAVSHISQLNGLLAGDKIIFEDRDPDRDRVAVSTVVSTVQQGQCYQVAWDVAVPVNWDQSLIQVTASRPAGGAVGASTVFQTSIQPVALAVGDIWIDTSGNW